MVSAVLMSHLAVRKSFFHTVLEMPVRKATDAELRPAKPEASILQERAAATWMTLLWTASLS